MLSTFVILFFNILLVFAFVPSVKKICWVKIHMQEYTKEARYIMTCWKKSFEVYFNKLTLFEIYWNLYNLFRCNATLLSRIWRTCHLSFSYSDTQSINLHLAYWENIRSLIWNVKVFQTYLDWCALLRCVTRCLL